MRAAVAIAERSAPRDFNTEIGIIGSDAKRDSTRRKKRRHRPDRRMGVKRISVDARLSRKRTSEVV
jgi:hypothetical protein